MRTMLPITLLLVLSGCSTYTSPMEVAAQDDATCKSFGAAQGSPAYTECRLAQQARRDQQNAARADGLRRAGEALQAPDRASRRETTCRSSRDIGGDIRTVCD